MASLFVPLVFGALFFCGFLVVMLTGRPSTGRALGASALGFLMGICFTSFCVRAANFSRSQRERGFAGVEFPGAPSSGQGKEQRFEKLNFILKDPGFGWVELNAKTLNKDSTYISRNAARKLTLSIVIEPTAQQLSTEILTEIARSNAGAGGEVTSFESLPSVKLGGVESACVYYEVTTLDGTPTRTVNIHHFDKSYARQFAVSTTADSSKEALARDAMGLAKLFQLIDPERWGATANPQEAGQRFPEWACAMEGGGAGWSKVGGEDAVRGQIWHGSLHAGGHLLLVPLALPEVELDDQSLLRGLLSGSTDRGIPANGVARKKLEIPGAEGWEYVYQENVPQLGEYHRVTRIIRRGGMAWLLDGGAKVEQPQRIEEMLKVMDGFQLLPPAGGDAPAVSPDFLAQFCNQAGLSYYIRGLYPQARALFELASGTQPQDVTYFSNVLDALLVEDKPSEIRERIALVPAEIRDTTEVRSREASALAALGLVEEAGKAYLALFGGGLRDDSILSEAAEFFMENGRAGEALDLLSKYRAEGTNRQLDLIHARLLSRGGKKEESLAMLEKLHKSASGNQDILIEYAEALRVAERKDEGLALVRGAAEAAPEDVRMLYQLGYHLADSAKYEEAAEVLEKASSLAPKDQTILDELAYVRGRLGRGHDSEVRVALDPVALPPSLQEQPVWDPATAPQDAERLQLRQVTVHEFKSGTPKKRTVYNDIVVLSSRAVEGLSTLKFSFKPLGERIYLNRLEVLDATGKVISEGNEKSQYVTSVDETDATGGKVLCVPVPGLAEGCRLRYEVTYQDRSPSSSFPFESVFFASRYGSRQMTVCLKAGKESFAVRTIGAIESGREGDHQLWTVRDIQATPADSNLPKMELLAPVLYLGPAGTDWKKIGDGYIEDISKQLVVDSDVESLARDITSQAASEEDRIRLIFRWVQREFTYKAIEFGTRARIPHQAGVTCANRYGDCKDLSVVLHTMLRAVGVPSRLCLVHTSDDVHPDLPTLDQFNHMIVHLPASSGRAAAWLDPTEKYHADVLQVGAWLEGRHTLILEQGSSHMVMVPAISGKSGDKVEFVRSLRSSEGGTVAFHEVAKFQGYAADGFRSYLLSIPAAERLQKFSELLVAVEPRLKMDNLEVRHLQDQDQPLELEITARVEDAASADGTLKRLPILWEKDYLRSAPQDGRRTPFSITQRWAVEGEIIGKMALPGTPAPARSADRAEWGGWEIRTTSGEGGWKVAYAGGLQRIPSGGAADYSAYFRFWDDGLMHLAAPWQAVD